MQEKYEIGSVGTMTGKHVAHKITSGHYLYRGFFIICIGYYNQEQRVCWEAYDSRGYGFAHGYTLKDSKRLVDRVIDEYDTDYTQFTEEQIQKETERFKTNG